MIGAYDIVLSNKPPGLLVARHERVLGEDLTPLRNEVHVQARTAESKKITPFKPI
jgi:hypothetical protein